LIFTELIEKLNKELTFPLPGLPIQMRMTSNRRLREIMEFQHSDQPIKSSVLILLYPGTEFANPKFVVTLRRTYEGIHSGQISLPGGKFETSDIVPVKTALRETYEEIGVDPALITIIGKLTELYIPPSNYLVQPFVGFMDSAPLFFPQAHEVEKIIEIPVNGLLIEENVVMKEITAGGFQFQAPTFQIEGTTIWGATAMILSEFKEILSRSGS